MLREIASRRAIQEAVADWKSKFSRNASIFRGLGGDIYWHDALGVWGVFTRYQKESGLKYWNVFGRKPFRFRSNIVVEVNPPLSSSFANVVGLVAGDDNGDRWMLHRGHLHMSRFNIDAELFRQAVHQKPERIILSTGETAPYTYYRVARIDGSDEEVVSQTADFVAECAGARAAYAKMGHKPSAKFLETKKSLSAESTGGYILPPQEARDAYRWHADVWAALTKQLETRGLDPSNGRVGAFGPDLRTDKHLFEIKTDASSPSVQQGVGQLFLYEVLLGRRYSKVLVLPDGVPTLSGALDKLGIGVLTYLRRGKTVYFSDKDISGLFRRS